jgi:hypothetical protein
MPLASPDEDESCPSDSEQSSIKSQESDSVAMYTAISLVSFAVGVGIAIAFLPTAWHNKDRAALIYCFTAIFVFAAIGVGAALLAATPADQPTRLDVAQRAVIGRDRSYIQLSNFVIGVGGDKTLVVFWLTVDGSTYVDVESGEISISIDDPPLSPEDRGKGIYTAQIGPQRIIPRQRAVQNVPVAPLPVIHQERLLKGPPTEVFYVGKIRYWDAFRDQGTHRHTREFAYGVKDGILRSLDMALWARNNETDDPD